MPADYVGTFLASLSQEELLKVVSENRTIEAAKEHFEKNMADKPAEFYYVSNELSDELKRDLNSFFSNEKKNK